MQSVTVELPEHLYQRMSRRALARRASVEEEVARVLADALGEESAPEDAAPVDVMAQLPYLDDEALWQAARTRVAADRAQRMQELIWKQQAEGLTAAEEDEANVLQRHGQQVMLLRAEAAALLAERGHDVTELVAPAGE
jgi:hypothetical protein